MSVSMKIKEQEINLGELLHGISLEYDKEVEVCTAQRIMDCRCALGECVVFDDRLRAVLWTDIYGECLYKLQLDYQGGRIINTTYKLPKKLCSFGLLDEIKPGTELPLLCAWEDGFQIYDVATGKEVSPMSQGEDVNPHKGDTRLNDGRTDPAGKRFICGAYYGGNPEFFEKVFKVEQRDGVLVHEPILEDIQTANSINWMLDGTRMYLADSPTKKIFSFAYNPETGALSDKQLFHEKPANEKFVPDGSCVDSEGFLWNAVWCHGESPSMVQRIDPKTGLVVFTVHVPDATSQVSCCCFGGMDMDVLFITSASTGRDQHKQPHAGALYAIKVPFQGRHESRLKFSY